MRRRVFGIETEYGITCASTRGGEPPLSAEQAAEALFQRAPGNGRSTNMFLQNGGRLYLDVGAHPEYATAECAGVWDLLAQVRAGSDILAEMSEKTTGSLQAEGIPGQIHLFANNFDSSGNSFGCHENYLLRRRRDFREMADALITFFVTRQVIAGAGDVKQDDNGHHYYAFSARSDQMHDSLSAATTRVRPIINTRDEPLADAGDYRRLHVIVGDTNIAEPTTALKVAATDMVLNAMEQGVGYRDLALADPMGAIRKISDDVSGTAKVELADGALRTAAELQEEILVRSLKVLDVPSLSPLYRYLLDLWGRTVDAVKKGDWSPIDREIDFAIKKKLLDGYVSRSGLSLGDPKVTRLLLSYHDITEGGLAPRLEDTGLMVRLTDRQQVTRAMEEPPSDTRASLRGEVIRKAARAGRNLGVDWVTLRLEGYGTQVTLQDPFSTEDPRVASMLSTIAK